MTFVSASGENSPLAASVIPATLRATSITAICIPRQMPRKGTLFSRAKRIASILPSLPRCPKPPGTSTPAKPLSCLSAPTAAISSAST